MKLSLRSTPALLKSALTLLVAFGLTATTFNSQAVAKGGVGGGGSTTTKAPKVVESRVTGYVTAINYETRTITIGASYYGMGALKVTDNTDISLDNYTSNFDSLKLGDWVEARYNFSTKEATKLACTTIVSS